MRTTAGKPALIATAIAASASAATARTCEPYWTLASTFGQTSAGMITFDDGSGEALYMATSHPNSLVRMHQDGSWETIEQGLVPL